MPSYKCNTHLAMQFICRILYAIKNKLTRIQNILVVEQFIIVISTIFTNVSKWNLTDFYNKIKSKQLFNSESENFLPSKIMFLVKKISVHLTTGPQKKLFY